MSEQDEALEALMFFANSVRTSMLYMVRRIEALEVSAARQDPFFNIPDLTEDEKAALAEALRS